MISVFVGMLPKIKTNDPYSPNAVAKDNANFVRIKGAGVFDAFCP
jgi:hypothetical protein